MPALQRERLDDGIVVLRLDRPDARNAMDSTLLAELDAALTELAADEELRVLVFSTTDVRALSAGADVREQLDPAGGVARMEAFARMYEAVHEFPAPTIAVCVGNTVGAGAELAAGCDLRVAGENLKLAWPGGRLGVPVGPARLVPLVGLSKARELIFTGRTIGAEEAERLGLLGGLAPAA
jgi:enoyl-CoA hydratase